jgi:long-chain acyl-CoA synthetase
VVIGDRRKFLSALLVPDFEALAGWAGENHLAGKPPEELIREPALRELLRGEVDKVNEGLAGYEKIVAWELLPAELTLEGGELTPTQKVKRRVVHEKYADAIEGLYAAAG